MFPTMNMNGVDIIMPLLIHFPVYAFQTDSVFVSIVNDFSGQ